MQRQYERLPGKGPRQRGPLSSFLTRCTLYLADDHLLAIDNRGYTEDYKRFYLNDIQAIITVETMRGDIWGFVLGIALVTTAGSGYVTASEGWRLFLWILSGLMLIPFMLNLLRGPTCSCRILTAVQQDELPSLSRLRNARKVTRRLQLAIEKIQGTLGSEQHYPAEGLVAPPSRLRPHSKQTTRGVAAERKYYDGRMHLAVCCLLLIEAALLGSELLSHTLAVSVLQSMVMWGLAICAIIAIVKQHASDIPASIRVVAWMALALVGLAFITGYGLMFSIIIQNAKREIAMSQWDMYKALFDMSPDDSRFLFIVDLLYMIFFAVMGANGLFWLWLFRRGHNRQIMPPVPPRG